MLNIAVLWSSKKAILLLMSDISDNEEFFRDLEEDFGELDEVEEEQDEVIEPTVFSNEEVDDEVKFVSQLIDGYSILKVDVLENQLPSSVSKVSKNERIIRNLLDKKKYEFVELLPLLTRLLGIIQEEISCFYEYSKHIYKFKFFELETLAPTAVQFAKTIQLIETMDDFSQHDLLSSKLETEILLTKEQVLVLIIAMKTSLNKEYSFEGSMKTSLKQFTDIIIQHDLLKKEITTFIESNIITIAPNLCALVGSEITSLLIGHAGGILELSQIPSCNLASVGKNKYFSHERQTNLSGVRQEGYIYNSELIQSQPVDYHKQLLRMLCAKISLAARVDTSVKISTSSTEPAAFLGQKWREEIVTKIRKLHEAANISDTKPLPIPQDAKKKKRAGRKFRKYKQQFELSHMRQLQNRMEFGKQETTSLDSFGEEVGYGMVNSTLRQTTGGNIRITKGANNTAKMTKKMKKRIEEANEASNEYLLSLPPSLPSDPKNPT
ncbi:hypothetical protein Kpol_1018p138 [Vanderwaltozyma polyspora DSM 70294]|uniref:Nop domain-containing protein n=1 Tax=Vanderwaltozyma polyspora (strain ATCC 22028 / DSM 70294 / BCRC 21397 / CBS 2163 / NBRC 10782 / NRRL Y-8283 / UCD 57-17) TaxID=436907 RepID=A7TDY0_VANPO|nr:uncharacterized protein Kpol_1018p138 [Vanderwaltozyma polyspora DSM 70294]EDO19600.1 hypothetical protein Kpol_1018p138 [Vanderwaltozyma polyspora DSM 70294]